VTTVLLAARLVQPGDVVHPDPCGTRTDRVASAPTSLGGGWVSIQFASGEKLATDGACGVGIDRDLFIDARTTCRHGCELVGGFGGEPAHNGAHTWPDEDLSCDDSIAKARKVRQAAAQVAREKAALACH
jgi:hypothetical protein